MLVGEILNRDIKTCRPDTTVREAAQTMNKWRIGSLVVVDGTGKVVGIVTERDILRDVVAAGKQSNSVNVEEIMTREVVMIDKKATLEEAAQVMTERKIKKLPVLDRGTLVGIVTATDLITYEHALIEKMATLLRMKKPSAICG